MLNPKRITTECGRELIMASTGVPTPVAKLSIYAIVRSGV